MSKECSKSTLLLPLCYPNHQDEGLASLQALVIYGGDREDRTPDLLIANHRTVIIAFFHYPLRCMIALAIGGWTAHTELNGVACISTSLATLVLPQGAYHGKSD